MTNSNSHTFIIRKATDSDYLKMDALAAIAFGPGRYTRTAFRLREGVAPESSLCFVATRSLGQSDDDKNNEIVGSVRLTRICVGGQECLILGPLIASPNLRSMGMGRELMNRAIHAAKKEGHKFIILVGDFAYYQRFGFKKIANGKLTLPGPVDTQRLLGLELVDGASDLYEGLAQRIVQ